MERRAGLLLVLLFVVTLPAVTPRIYASDEIQYFAYLRSLWFDRDVSFENEYRWFYDRGIAASPGFHETFLERTTETGRRINFGTIGSALLWAPFYAVGDLVARARASSDPSVTVDGFSAPYIAAVAYGSAAYGMLALWLSIRIARRLVGPALAPALAVLCGTPLVFYMYVAPPMSHACSAFAVALFTLTWLRARETWSPGWAVALGLSGALMAMVREQDLFFVAGPALDWLRTLALARTPRATVVRAGVVGALSAAAGFVPQALAYLSLNGYMFPSRLVTRKMTWTAPHALDVLTSTSHGFLVWTPLAALAILGLVWMVLTADPPATPFSVDDRPRRRQDVRWIAMCLLAMMALQVYVAGSVESWTVAGAFGQRRFVAVSALLTVGLSVWWAHARTRVARRVLVAAFVLGAWWNLGLIVQFGMRLMDRQRLEPARNAYTSFVELPRMLPGIVARYFGARDSFYEQKPPTP